MTTKRKSTGIKKNHFRSAYDVGNLDYSELHNPEHALTEQSHKSSCDINLILAQFIETGLMPNIKNPNPQYGDVSDINFQDIQNQLATAKTLFEELPEHVKGQFDNEPFKFLQFAENPDNAQALIDMGLANAPKKEPMVQSLETEDANSSTSPLGSVEEIASDKSENSDASV